MTKSFIGPTPKKDIIIQRIYYISVTLDRRQLACFLRDIVKTLKNLLIKLVSFNEMKTEFPKFISKQLI